MDEEIAYADVKITLGIVFLCLMILAICALSIMVQCQESAHRVETESVVDSDQSLHNL